MTPLPLDPKQLRKLHWLWMIPLLILVIYPLRIVAVITVTLLEIFED